MVYGFCYVGFRMEIIKSDAIKAHGARNRNRYYIIAGLPKGVAKL